MRMHSILGFIISYKELFRALIIKETDFMLACKKRQTALLAGSANVCGRG
jgi:hypothetical protein